MHRFNQVHLRRGRHVLAVRANPRRRRTISRLDRERPRLDALAGARRLDHCARGRHPDRRRPHFAEGNPAPARAGLCRDLPEHSAAGADVLLVLRASRAAAGSHRHGDQADGPAVGQLLSGGDRLSRDRASLLADHAPDRAGGAVAKSRQREVAAMMVDLSAIVSAGPYLMQGLWFTLQITLVGVAGGIVFGSLLAVARLSHNRLVAMLATAYVNLMRSIPLILVIFWVFFLVPWAIGWLTRSGRPVAVGASLTIFVTFVLFEAAYYAEIVRAGFRSISPGQYSACDALGLSKFHAYIYILFPQAIRNVLPILLTQTIVLFQDTSLVYVISATDLLGGATKLAQRDGRLVEMYLTVGVIYFLICYAASQLVKQLQRRLAFGVR